MVNCAIVNCKNTSSKISKCRNGITFHRFPLDKDRRKRWEIAVNREKEWTSTASSAVCSDHFEAKDFYLTTSGLRRLTQDTVPAINISVCEERQPIISIMGPCDITSTDSEEVMQLKHEVKRLTVIAEQRKRQVKVLWQAHKRITDKYKSMKCVVAHLVKNKHGNKIFHKGKRKKVGNKLDNI